ncbi:MAG: endonuclease domain-containing protein, partial [Paludibacteraceae bacterium]|nr:endonuclease domain-containing protein [Paludibacteraceae bacterium]
MDENKKYDRANGYWGEQLIYPDTYPIMLSNSRRNRKDMTDAETALWSIIRNKQLGYKFRRQYIIGDYITDFACIEKHLILEVDGGYHFTDEQRKEDEIRTQFISRMGFRVLRFANGEVIADTESVRNKIKQI